MGKRSFEHLLIWTGTIEIFFAGGIFYGWPALQFVLKEEKVFYELCGNGSFTNTSSVEDDGVGNACVAQDNIYNTLFVLGCMMSNCFGMVYGYILENKGLFACRMATSIPFSFGLVLIIFYENRWLFIVGIELVAIGGIGVLLTNLTVQPIWPKRTSTIGSIFSGVFDGSAGTIMLVKVLYGVGLSLKSLLVALAAFSLIQWIRTFFIMPIERMSTPLPVDYDIRRETFVAKIKLKKDNSRNQQLVEEVDLKLVDKDIIQEINSSNNFFSQIKSKKFILLAFWYCIVSLRINSYQSWFNPSLQWMFKDQSQTQSFLTDIFGITYIMSVPISPAPGAIVDFVANRYQKTENNLDKGQRIGIAGSCMGISISTTLLSYLCTYMNSVPIAITTQVLFSIIRTFVYAVLAQASFLLFPHHLFGLIYGFLNLLNGLTTLFADPIFRFIQGPLEGDYTFVHWAMGFACLTTAIQSIHLLRTPLPEENRPHSNNG